MAVGAWFLFFRNKGNSFEGPLAPMMEAADKSMAALEDYTKDLPNLNKIVENVREMEKAGAITAEPGMKNQNYLCYKQTGFGGYDEGVGTLRAAGGDIGGDREPCGL